MIIGVCGFAVTGSSAVSDLLAEFEDNKIIDEMEFVLPYYPDGLEDLDFHLNCQFSKYASSAVAIERFRRMVYVYLVPVCRDKKKKEKLIALTEDFLKEITQVKWRGYGAADFALNCSRFYKSGNVMLKVDNLIKKHVIKRVDKKLGKNIDIYPVHNMEFSVNPENFDEEAKRYVRQILELLGAVDGKNIVLDQPFTGNDPVKSFKFFDNPKAIVVDRDPRDVYLFVKKFLLHVARQIPTDSVQDFVEYYSRMRNNQKFHTNNPNVLHIRFEDLIYEYDKTVQEIMDFCGLKTHDCPRSIFEPSMSINNTQMYKKFPECKDDIAYIEKMLPQYLYPFEKYGEVDNTGKMFYGRSPLHNKS